MENSNTQSVDSVVGSFDALSLSDDESNATAASAATDSAIGASEMSASFATTDADEQTISEELSHVDQVAINERSSELTTEDDFHAIGSAANVPQKATQSSPQLHSNAMSTTSGTFQILLNLIPSVDARMFLRAYSQRLEDEKRQLNDEYLSLIKRAAAENDIGRFRILKQFDDFAKRKRFETFGVHQDPEDAQLIRIACQNNAVKIVDFLLNIRLARVEAEKDELGRSAFYYAIEQNNVTLLDMLLVSWMRWKMAAIYAETNVDRCFTELNDRVENIIHCEDRIFDVDLASESKSSKVSMEHTVTRAITDAFKNAASSAAGELIPETGAESGRQTEQSQGQQQGSLVQDHQQQRQQPQRRDGSREAESHSYETPNVEPPDDKNSGSSDIAAPAITLLTFPYYQLRNGRTPEMKTYILNRLHFFRFHGCILRLKQFSDYQASQGPVVTVEKWISIILALVELLKQYSDRTQLMSITVGTSVLPAPDMQALSIIAICVRVLKGIFAAFQELPWDEVLFCVACVISYATKHDFFQLTKSRHKYAERILSSLRESGEYPECHLNWLESYCRGQFDKMCEIQNLFLNPSTDYLNQHRIRILNEVYRFAVLLNEVRDKMTDAVKALRQQGSSKEAFATRKEIVTQVLERTPSFKSLYEVHDDIRDEYSMKRIQEYCHLALDAPDDEIGRLLICRSLLVAGEYFKGTADSPHLSNNTRELFHARKLSLKSIQAVRDALAHSKPLITDVSSDRHEMIYKELKKDIGVIVSAIDEVQQNKEGAAPSFSEYNMEAIGKLEEIFAPLTTEEKETVLEDVDDHTKDASLAKSRLLEMLTNTASVFDESWEVLVRRLVLSQADRKFLKNYIKDDSQRDECIKRVHKSKDLYGLLKTYVTQDKQMSLPDFEKIKKVLTSAKAQEALERIVKVKSHPPKACNTKDDYIREAKILIRIINSYSKNFDFAAVMKSYIANPMQGTSEWMKYENMYTGNKRLQAVVEIQVLRLENILKESRLSWSVPGGAWFRNYLAHGNPLIDSIRDKVVTLSNQALWCVTDGMALLDLPEFVDKLWSDQQSRSHFSGLVTDDKTDLIKPSLMKCITISDNKYVNMMELRRFTEYIQEYVRNVMEREASKAFHKLFTEVDQNNELKDVMVNLCKIRAKISITDFQSFENSEDIWSQLQRIRSSPMYVSLFRDRMRDLCDTTQKRSFNLIIKLPWQFFVGETLIENYDHALSYEDMKELRVHYLDSKIVMIDGSNVISEAMDVLTENLNKHGLFSVLVYICGTYWAALVINYDHGDCQAFYVDSVGVKMSSTFKEWLTELTENMRIHEIEVEQKCSESDSALLALENANAIHKMIRMKTPLDEIKNKLASFKMSKQELIDYRQVLLEKALGFRLQRLNRDCSKIPYEIYPLEMKC